jgi:hypothetical protein
MLTAELKKCKKLPCFAEMSKESYIMIEILFSIKHPDGYLN